VAYLVRLLFCRARALLSTSGGRFWCKVCCEWTKKAISGSGLDFSRLDDGELAVPAMILNYECNCLEREQRCGGSIDGSVALWHCSSVALYELGGRGRKWAEGRGWRVGFIDGRVGADCGFGIYRRMTRTLLDRITDSTECSVLCT
jgi:hypothetical protein